MHRPRYLWFALAPILFVLVVTATGCGGAAEEPLVRKFFQASRLGDNMTLANIATVQFDPNTDGRADGVKVVSVTPEQSRQLHFKELDQVRKEAVAAEDEFSKRMKDYRDKNMDAINRVLKSEAANAKLKGGDAAVQVAWAKWRTEQADFAKKVSEAKAKLNAERRVAELSLPDKDPTGYDAVEYTKELTVSANVRMPNGQSASKTYILTLQRVVLKDASGNPVAEGEGRWMITKLQPAAAGATS